MHYYNQFQLPFKQRMYFIILLYSAPEVFAT